MKRSPIITHAFCIILTNYQIYYGKPTIRIAVEIFVVAFFINGPILKTNREWNVGLSSIVTEIKSPRL